LQAEGWHFETVLWTGVGHTERGKPIASNRLIVLRYAENLPLTPYGTRIHDKLDICTWFQWWVTLCAEQIAKLLLSCTFCGFLLYRQWRIWSKVHYWAVVEAICPRGLVFELICSCHLLKVQSFLQLPCFLVILLMDVPNVAAEWLAVPCIQEIRFQISAQRSAFLAKFYVIFLDLSMQMSG
jgi:hypothetical protein